MASAQRWGYKYTISADVCESTGKAMASALGVHEDGKPKAPLRWCKRALAECDNDEVAALAWLEEHQDEMATLDAARQGEMNTQHDKSEAAGFYRDSKSGMGLNIQTAEVQVQGRSMFPMPNNVVQKSRFQSIFGMDTPLCALMDTT